MSRATLGGVFANAIAAALGDSRPLPIVHVVTEGDSTEAMVARARGVAATCVLLVIEPTVPRLQRAMLAAAIGPLAIEMAPESRVGAIDILPGADPADVAAAAMFLATAESTTGQVIAVSGE